MEKKASAEKATREIRRSSIEVFGSSPPMIANGRAI